MSEPEPERLSKRVAAMLQCSRREAEQIVEGGFVSVDGRVVDLPQQRISGETVVVDPAARAGALEPVTLLWHASGALDAEGGAARVPFLTAAQRWPEDPSQLHVPLRRLARLAPLLPLEPGASGLAVLSEDERVRRRLVDEAALIEQEFLVETAGQIAPGGLERLRHGLRYRGWPLPPCKASWQNEFRLRFALKAVQPGQLRDMCAQVGLELVALRRLRIGTVSLGKMPAGMWRVQPASVRF
jgi:23S rRNA pseudouridine2604 synthase